MYCMSMWLVVRACSEVGGGHVSLVLGWIMPLTILEDPAGAQMRLCNHGTFGDMLG